MDGELNPYHVEKQDLSKGDVAKIIMLHNEKDMLFSEMELLDSDDPSLRSYAKKIEDLEFRMQDAWKWDRDATKHTHWFQAPHCTCPSMDNWDEQVYGVGGRRWITGGCPLHSPIVFVPLTNKRYSRTLVICSWLILAAIAVWFNS